MAIKGVSVLYRLVILDDEPCQAEDLRNRILSHPQADEFEVVTCTSAKGLEAEIKQSRIDILFTDICLDQDGCDGVDLVESLHVRDAGTQVVFITGFNGMYARVRQASDSFFLMKPIRDDELFHVMDRALAVLAKQAKEVLLIHSIEGELVVQPSDILYIESWKRVVEIHLLNGDSPRAYMRLADMLDMLPASFVQCHKSYIVNMAHVTSLHTDSLSLASGKELAVARGRRRQTQEAFEQYWRGELRGGVSKSLISDFWRLTTV